MGNKDSYDLAKEILDHEEVDNVRVSKNSIEVVEYLDPENTPTKHNMDKEVLEYVKNILKDTLFVPDGGDWLDQRSEKHDTLGGRSHRTVTGGTQEQLIRRYVK